MEAYTISVTRGNVAKDHDERTFYSQNVDKRLSDRNVSVIQYEDSYQNLVNDFFHEATVEYNEKQERYRHRDRMIQDDDYYTALLEGKTGFGSKHKERNKDGVLVEVDSQEKPIYEYVIGIGNNHTLGLTDEEFSIYEWRDKKRRGMQDEADKMVDAHLRRDDPAREALKDVLVETAQELQGRYPSFKFWLAIVHDDEPCGSCHLHLAFTPFTKGGKNGMQKRVSQTRALAAMGFRTSKDKNGKTRLAIEAWQDDVKAVIEEKMLQRGYGVEVKNEQRKHEETSAYVARKEAEYWAEQKDDLETKCENLNNTIEKRFDKIEELEDEISELEAQQSTLVISSTGATAEELDEREVRIKKREAELDAKENVQLEFQKALETKDEAYQVVVSAYQDERDIYKKRYGMLFAGLDGLAKKLPEPGRAMLLKLIQGVTGMDSYDRYGIRQYERTIASSEQAYKEAQQQFDLAAADYRAAIRAKRVGKAKDVSRDVQKNLIKNDREKEFGG